MKSLVFLACIVAAVIASSKVKRETYSLPDGAELIIGNIQESFSCADRIYGYYADVANGCKIFHVCLPREQPDGTVKNQQFSFFCGNQTVFDQEALVCAHPEDAFPCDQAEARYSINSEFGKTDKPRS